MEREYIELLIEARRVLGTPYITINDRSFYVMLPYEAFNTVQAGDLTAEDFEKFKMEKNIFYIAEVTL
jgi:hypothetical protein